MAPQPAAAPAGDIISGAGDIIGAVLATGTSDLSSDMAYVPQLVCLCRQFMARQ